MCGAGRFLFAVNIVHICQELCQTQSATPSSQLVFSGQIFDLEQNDKMTSDCSRQIFVNVGVFSRPRGREVIIKFTSLALLALRSVKVVR